MLEEEAQLKYLGISLEQTYGNWLAILWNINRARKVWGKLVKIMQRYGCGAQVSKMLYRAVVQVVLLFVSES